MRKSMRKIAGQKLKNK